MIINKPIPFIRHPGIQVYIPDKTFTPNQQQTFQEFLSNAKKENIKDEYER